MIDRTNSHVGSWVSWKIRYTYKLIAKKPDLDPTHKGTTATTHAHFIEHKPPQWMLATQPSAQPSPGVADVKAAAREAEKSQLQFREMLEQRTSELQVAPAAREGAGCVSLKIGIWCEMFASGSAVQKEQHAGRFGTRQARAACAGFKGNSCRQNLQTWWWDVWVRITFGTPITGWTAPQTWTIYGFRVPLHFCLSLLYSLYRYRLPICRSS